MFLHQTQALIRFAALLLCCSVACAALAQGDSARGIAIPIGGALKADNAEVWSRIVELAGGRNAHFVVLATASEDPAKSAAAIVKSLNRYGARAEFLPVSTRSKGESSHRGTDDAALIAKVKKSSGVYFAGGAQERIVDTFLEADGSPTPMLKAIRDLFQRGGVVAGSSAGAAIMSSTMFRDPPDNLTVLKQGLKAGKDIDRGLGFVGSDLFVDQHFLRRGRLGRMLPLMRQTGYRLGLGVEENSAAIVRGGQVEIIGAQGALLVDLSDATSDSSIDAFNLRGARISLLGSGDRIDLNTRNVMPSAQKLAASRLDPNDAGFRPYYTGGDRFYADVLAEGMIPALLTHLIDSRQKEALGLAWRPRTPADRDVQPDLGFEFRFRKGPDSVGYFLSAGGAEDYTVINILVDVRPVRFADPLYRDYVSGSNGRTGAN
jgi:cyanophycinase